MIAINAALGFQLRERCQTWQLDVRGQQRPTRRRPFARVSPGRPRRPGAGRKTCRFRPGSGFA